MKKDISNRERLYYQEEKNSLLYENISKKNYILLQILKDTSRSYVILIEVEGNKYIYKEPREKNSRKWQRFLSMFRGSESRREGFQMQEIQEKGFLGPRFCYAYEKYIYGMVESSHLVYEYVEGQEPSIEEAEEILKELQRIHAAGYLHGDSQISNFLVDNRNRIYLIDSKFKRNCYGAFGEAYEIYYFELSCPQIRLNINRERWSYRVATFWKDIREAWIRFKTRRRERK